MLLKTAQPVVLVEVADPAGQQALFDWLLRLGYSRSSRSGFQPWNHLFVPTQTPGEVVPVARRT
jgi:hypothetical protein